MIPANRSVPNLDPQADMHTASGQAVFFTEPAKTQIYAFDLYTHLKNQNRYNGAVECSILMHLAICVTICELSEESEAFTAQVAAHDLHEAYVSDMVTGMKRRLYTFQDIEVSWEVYLYAQLGIPRPEKDDIYRLKDIDMAALYGEMHLFGHPAKELVTLKDPPMRYVAKAAAARMSNVGPEAHWKVLCRAIPALARL